MPGSWLEALLEEKIRSRIASDPRTLAAPGTFLGFPKERVFSEAIGGGQADFDAPVAQLDGFDKALLYARYNQPGHLEELDHAFRQLLDGQGADGRGMTVLDVGCGPFTAGLALANVIGPAKPFRYYGIDISTSMLALARELASGARNLGALHPSTSTTFLTTLDDVQPGPVRSDLTLVVASYLLASPTIDPVVLVDQIVSAARRVGPGPVAVVYTNSGRPGANQHYPTFRQQLTAADFERVAEETENFNATRGIRYLRYALFFKREQLRISFGDNR